MPIGSAFLSSLLTLTKYLLLRRAPGVLLLTQKKFSIIKKLEIVHIEYNEYIAFSCFSEYRLTEI